MVARLAHPPGTRSSSRLSPALVLCVGLVGSMLLAVAPVHAEPSTAAPEAWSSRPKRSFELSVGNEIGWRTFKVAPDDVRGTGSAGGVVSFGVRSVRPYDGDTALSGLAGKRGSGFDGWVWCAPIACAGVGLLFLPYSAFVGNEWGVDLRLHVTRDFKAGSEGTFVAAGLRPVFRVFVDESRLRSASILGTLLPEMGLEISTVGSKAAYFEVNPFPIGLYLNRWAAIGWDVVLLRVMVPLGDSTANGRIGTALSFVLP